MKDPLELIEKKRKEGLRKIVDKDGVYVDMEGNEVKPEPLLEPKIIPRTGRKDIEEILSIFWTHSTHGRIEEINAYQTGQEIIVDGQTHQAVYYFKIKD